MGVGEVGGGGSGWVDGWWRAHLAEKRDLHPQARLDESWWAAGIERQPPRE